MRLSLLAMLVPFVLRTGADTMEVVSVIDADGSELSKKVVWLPESGWARSFYIIGGCSPRDIPNITTICLDPVRRRAITSSMARGTRTSTVSSRARLIPDGTFTRLITKRREQLPGTMYHVLGNSSFNIKLHLRCYHPE